MTIRYKIDNFKIIKLFGDEFVKRNKKNCKILINGIKQDLCAYYQVNRKKHGKFLEIKLKEEKTITDMSYMFHCCSLMISLSISNWNMKNIVDMSYMFYSCISLNYLSDISEWDTGQVNDMSYMFFCCSSLNNIDISKWNTFNVVNMNGIFFGCSSLKYLPDISNWNTINLIDMSNMFI